MEDVNTNEQPKADLTRVLYMILYFIIGRVISMILFMIAIGQLIYTWVNSAPNKKGYYFLLHFNPPPLINFVRRVLGIKRYWSLSKQPKDNLRDRLHFIEDYENMSTKYVKQKGYDGVIFGHIHKADIKNVEGVEYKNCGDWVELCTALVETIEGGRKIIDWLDESVSCTPRIRI